MNGIHDMQVEHVDPNTLRLWPGNARRGVVAGIKESMRVNGMFSPVVVQKSTDLIIIGNHRFQAWQELATADPDRFGSTVPAIFLDVNDARATKINLADNKTADDASWDTEALLAQLLEVQDLDGGLLGTGFADDDIDDLQALLESTEQLGYDDEDDPNDVGAREGSVGGINADGQRGNDDMRMMILNMPVANYVWLDDALVDLAEKYGTDSNTATIIRAVEELTGDTAPSHEDAPRDVEGEEE